MDVFVVVACLLSTVTAQLPRRPNIIVIVSDDQGYQDAGFRGSDILTPNIDRLATEGVILENHYVMPQCSPTRASLMTGRLGIRNGFWKGNIAPSEQWGLRLNETLMPEMLKRNGYKTHAIGKWHCGFYSWQHTPAQRGFDTFLGGFLGAQKYFSHKRGVGLDFRENYHDENGNFVEKLRRDLNGIYNTNIFSDRAVDIINNHDQTDPLFMYLAYTAPHHPFEVSKADQTTYTSHMTGSSSLRKKYAAMISVMDKGIGQVVDALDATGMRDNTLIVFFSDNGAVVGWPGSNHPLRGGKHGLGEGSVRSLAFVNSPLLQKTGYTNKDLFHVTDWYKTFQELARDEPDNAEKVQLPTDGMNIWNSIANNKRLGRNNVLINMRVPEMIHDVPDAARRLRRGADTMEIKTSDFFVIRHKNWKLYSGRYLLQGWTSENNLGKVTGTSSLESGTRLYNLDTDPSEKNDVSQDYPKLVQKILAKKQGFQDKMTWIGSRPRSGGMKKKVWMPWITLTA